MEKKRYTFSKEVKPDLLEFYKIATEKKHVNPQSNIWKLLLPKNHLLISDLNQTQYDVIDLTEDEVKSPKPDIEDFSNIGGNESVADLNTSTVNDVIDSIKESLETDHSLNNNLIKDLKKFDNDRINEIFIVLSRLLDTESVCKFGNDILKNNFLEHNAIIEYFNKHILIPRLFLEHNVQIHSLFVSFLNQFSSNTSQEFANRILEAPEGIKCIQDNLTSLGSSHKQKLLREFILRSTKLDKEHFLIIECLLSNETDIESLQKLIELLTVVSSIFSSDMVFGKLLLNIISNSKNKIVHFEQQVVHIISLHRSVWKNKLNKTMNECMANNSSMSQSLRY